MSKYINRNAVIAIIEKKRLLVGKHDLSAEYKLAGVQEEIESLPTFFGFESAIKQLEQKRDYYYSEMKNTGGCCVDVFNEYHNKGIAFNEALDILKSAANATNGRNGG